MLQTLICMRETGDSEKDDIHVIIFAYVYPWL